MFLKTALANWLQEKKLSYYVNVVNLHFIFALVNLIDKFILPL